jgi:hypothetical protein
MGPGRSLSERRKIGTSAAEATTYKDSPAASQGLPGSMKLNQPLQIQKLK